MWQERIKHICYQTWGQLNSGIGIFFNGIDKFGIEVCYTELNSQINLPLNELIQLYMSSVMPYGY